MSFRRLRRLIRRAVLPGLALALIIGLIVPHLYAWDHLRRARVELDRGHNAAAALHLRRTLAIHPNSRDGLLLAARVARRSAAWNDADVYLDRYWHEHGDDPDIAFERLLGRAARGDTTETLPVLVGRIQNGGGEAELAREALITGLLARYRWGDAETGLKAWLDESPENILALHLYGQLLEQRNQTSLALQTFRRAVELDPEHLDSRLRMTTLLLQLRQSEEVLPHLDFLRSRLPDNPEVQVQRARALELLGRTAEARAAVEECLQQRPHFAPALAERGKLAMGEGNDAAAIADLALAARLDPGELSSRKSLALLLLRNGQTEAAAAEDEAVRRLEADYQKIAEMSQGPLQTRPDDPSIPHEIGLIALRAGQLADATRWFQNALQVDSNYLPTHQVLASYYHEIGSPALAAKHRAIAQKLGSAKKP